MSEYKDFPEYQENYNQSIVGTESQIINQLNTYENPILTSTEMKFDQNDMIVKPAIYSHPKYIKEKETNETKKPIVKQVVQIPSKKKHKVKTAQTVYNKEIVLSENDNLEEFLQNNYLQDNINVPLPTQSTIQNLMQQSVLMGSNYYPTSSKSQSKIESIVENPIYENNNYENQIQNENENKIETKNVPPKYQNIQSHHSHQSQNINQSNYSKQTNQSQQTFKAKNINQSEKTNQSNYSHHSKQTNQSHHPNQSQQSQTQRSTNQTNQINQLHPSHHSKNQNQSQQINQSNVSHQSQYSKNQNQPQQINQISQSHQSKQSNLSHHSQQVNPMNQSQQSHHSIKTNQNQSNHSYHNQPEYQSFQNKQNFSKVNASNNQQEQNNNNINSNNFNNNASQNSKVQATKFPSQKINNYNNDYQISKISKIPSTYTNAGKEYSHHGSKISNESNKNPYISANQNNIQDIQNIQNVQNIQNPLPNNDLNINQVNKQPYTDTKIFNGEYGYFEEVTNVKENNNNVTNTNYQDNKIPQPSVYEGQELLNSDIKQKP